MSGTSQVSPIRAASAGNGVPLLLVRVADHVWISLVVPLAVLLAAMLLQRLEAALLTAPEPAEHPTDHAPAHRAEASAPALALVPPADPHHRTGAPTARATA